MSIAHFRLGLPALQEQLGSRGIETGSELWIDSVASWSFGSIAMLAFGLITAFCVLRLRASRWFAFPVAIVGVAYVSFGVAMYMLLNASPHFVGFIVIGGLLVVWALFAFRMGQLKT
jgi:hypothetical protein